jgi:hypothetical protein
VVRPRARGRGGEGLRRRAVDRVRRVAAASHRRGAFVRVRLWHDWWRALARKRVPSSTNHDATPTPPPPRSSFAYSSYPVLVERSVIRYPHRSQLQLSSIIIQVCLKCSPRHPPHARHVIHQIVYLMWPFKGSRWPSKCASGCQVLATSSTT